MGKKQAGSAGKNEASICNAKPSEKGYPKKNFRKNMEQIGKRLHLMLLINRILLAMLL